MADLVLTVLVVAALLMVVSLLQPIANRLSISYSVLLAAVGVAIGALALTSIQTEELGILGEIIHGLAGMDISAEVILYIFLPILLFETGLTIDVRRMMDDLAPILLLAIVAVVVCTIVVGVALGMVQSGRMDQAWIVCLMLGAIVATTDPAAVISTFREVGAPRRLTMLVEGESLLNDAAAIAMFVILMALLTTGQTANAATLAEAVWRFLYSFLGGCLVGAVGGWLTTLLLSQLRNLPLAEVTLTVALPYIMFIVGEHSLHVSGVVATVISALVVGATGRVRVTPESWESLIHVWHQLGFWSQTLVFLFASMLVPRFLVDISWTDVALVGLLVIAAFGARAIVLFGMLPLLSRLGLAGKVENSYKLVVVWGGLRGAVTLALALSVTENPLLSEEVKHFVGVLATGFVLFTLLVNATTLRPLIRLLGLNELSRIDRALRSRTLGVAIGSVIERIEETARDHRIAPEVASDLVASYRRRLDDEVVDTDSEVGLSSVERLRLGLLALADREEELYFRYFGEQTVSRRAVIGLLASVGSLRDAAKAGGLSGYVHAAQHMLGFSLGFRLANLAHQYLRIERPLADQLANRFESLLLMRVVVERLAGYVQTTLAGLLGRKVSGRLAQILTERIELCSQALEAMRLQYPDYAHQLEVRFLRQAALRLEEAEFHHLLAESAISREVFNDLDRQIEHAWSSVAKRPTLDLGLKTTELVARMPLFAGVSNERIAEIVGLLKPRLAVPGERLMSRGDRGDFMYFISSGALEVRRDGQVFRLGRGDFVGELALLSNRRRTADVVAIAYCHLLVLTRADFFQLLRSNPELREHIRRVAEARLAQPAAAAAPVAPDAPGADTEAAPA